MAILGDEVWIKTSTNSNYAINIYTPSTTRLALEALRNDTGIWRPSFLGGDWSAIDRDLIRYSKGEVWYCRAGTDSIAGSVQNLDVMLYLPDSDDCGITLQLLLPTW